MAKSTPSFEFTDGIIQDTTRFSQYWEKLRPNNFICFIVYATKGFMWYRMILMVVLLSAFYVNTGWAEASPQPTPLPGRITIGGTTYEIVSRTSMPGEMTSRLPNAYRFQMGQPIKRIDNSVRYWLGDVEFLRTPGGKFALPFEGSAPFVGYIDLAKNEFIYFKEPFTPTGEKRGKGSITRYEWTGVLDQRLKQPNSLWLLVRRWNRERQTYASHRVSIPLTDPGNIQVEMMKHAVVERVLAQTDNEILCQVPDKWNRNWARISKDSWAVLSKGKPSKKYGHLGRAVYSPDQGEIFAVFSGGGLVIFDAENGNEKAHLGKVGHYFNAFTFGATFDPKGSVAMVSTPYRHRITMIDVNTHRILSEYKTAFPLAGILFDEKELKAYAYNTFLPYE
jgi:hypothetical protein